MTSKEILAQIAKLKNEYEIKVREEKSQVPQDIYGTYRKYKVLKTIIDHDDLIGNLDNYRFTNSHGNGFITSDNVELATEFANYLFLKDEIVETYFIEGINETYINSDNLVMDIIDTDFLEGDLVSYLELLEERLLLEEEREMFKNIIFDTV